MGNGLMGHRRTLLAGGCMVSLLLTGCSKETLSKFFDGVGAPPPTRLVRRDLLKEIEELKREMAKKEAALEAREEKGEPSETLLPAEAAKTWAEAAKLLPKNTAGGVDWTQALQEKAIAHRPSPDPKGWEQAVLDLDVDLASSEKKSFWVTFSHSAHTRWLTCGNCHAAIFPLKRGAKPAVVTMTKIQAGEYCGVCHGPVVFGVNACARCHNGTTEQAEWHPTEEPRKPIERARSWDEAAKLLPAIDGMPNWSKALAEGVIAPRPRVDPGAEDEEVMDLDVERVPDGDEFSKVIFPHAAHTAWLTCDSCHPSLFETEGGATPMSMEKIEAGESCGVCHGKGVAFPVDACGRCHPAMAGG